jgi:chromate transporter
VSNAPRAVGFGEALRFWLKLGFVSFGGPAGQIAIMHRELVEAKRWISERRFLHALNYCMVLPGPEAQQLATYVGWLLHGTLGGIAAGALFVLPSLAILIALTWIYMAFGDVPAIAAILAGVKPAVVAIVIAAAWRIGSRALRHPLLWAIAAASFLALALFDVAFPAVVLAAGIVGIAGGRFFPSAFRPPKSSHGGGGEHLPSLIDDDTPPPAHARFSRPKLAATVLAALVFWAVPFFAIVGAFGWSSDFVRMAEFFTKAALVTFGGAYAVLPYVFQAAVETYGWLTAHQMLDGLALGETTPGPLIMVVAFIGFVGAWTKALLGPESLALSGALGATIATWFTFLPSFLFILAGGPFVERARDDVKLGPPLVAITASVVGVIASLAVILAWRIFLPDATREAPWSGHVDLFSLGIAAVALPVLVRGRLGVIPVIGLASAAGLLAMLWRA